MKRYEIRSFTKEGDNTWTIVLDGSMGRTVKVTWTNLASREEMIKKANELCNRLNREESHLVRMAKALSWNR